MKLSRQLGLTLREAKQKISEREFLLWSLDYAIEPWGDKRGDVQSGIICQTIAAYHGVETSINDYLPEFKLSEAMPVADACKFVFDGLRANEGIKWESQQQPS